jgi:hypothetical protein
VAQGRGGIAFARTSRDLLRPGKAAPLVAPARIPRLVVLAKIRIHFSNSPRSQRSAARILRVGPGQALGPLPFPALAKARGVERRKTPGGRAPRGGVASTWERLRGIPAPGLTDPERRLPALHATIAMGEPMTGAGPRFSSGLRRRLHACGPSVSQLLVGGLCYPQAEPRRRPVHGLRDRAAGAASAEGRELPGAGHRDRHRISDATPRSVPLHDAS